MADSNHPEPELNLAVELDDLLANAPSERDTAERWHHPPVTHQIDHCKTLLDASRLTDETDADVFIVNLQRGLANLRDRLAGARRRLGSALTRLGTQCEGEGEPSLEPWKQRRDALEGLSRRWDALLKNLDAHSRYMRDLEEEARRRWKEARRSSNSASVLLCAVVALAAAALATFAYGLSFWFAIGHWSGSSEMNAALVRESLFHTFDGGRLLLLLPVLLLVCWLAYRWLAAQAIEKSVGALKDHLEEVARYAAFRLPETDLRPPALPRIGTNVGWWGLPLPRLLLQGRTLALLGVFLLLLAGVWWLGWSKQPQLVVTNLDRCRAFEAMVLREGADRVALLADLRPLGEAIGDDDDSGKLGTMVLPHRHIDAIVQLGDVEWQPCQELNAPPVVDGVEVIARALGELGDTLVLAGTLQHGTTRETIAELTSTVSALGAQASRDASIEREAWERIFAGLPGTTDLTPVKEAIDRGFRDSLDKQQELISALEALDLEELVSAVDRQAETTDELRRISRLALCQEIRNALYKTWVTLLPGPRRRYIARSQEICEEIYTSLYNGAPGVTAAPDRLPRKASIADPR